jgi:hypothetical protein
LAATIAPAPCSRLRLALLAPCGSHLFSLHWPLGPSNQAFLYLYHPGGHLGLDLSRFSSPAPTQSKPQRTPTILGQESVHTMLSITHHRGTTFH